MTKVFINGISAKSGGGRSILTNFLKVAGQVNDQYRYIVAIPSLQGYDSFASERIRLVVMGNLSHTMMVPLVSVFRLPRLIKQFECDILFNISDVPVATAISQIFLFDWPYAAFPESVAWKLSCLYDRGVRYSKLFFFKALLPFVNLMIAQNDAIADQLRHIYGLSDVRVVPNAVSIDNLTGNVLTISTLAAGLNCSV